MSRDKKVLREIALELTLEQLLNTYYSLERNEFNSFSDNEKEFIENEIYKITLQFKKRYNL